MCNCVSISEYPAFVTKQNKKNHKVLKLDVNTCQKNVHAVCFWCHFNINFFIILSEDPEDVVLQKQALDCKQKILDDFIFNLTIY